MNTEQTAAVCALIAGALGAAVPVLVHRLPDPGSSPQGEDQPAPFYAEVGRAPGLTLLTAMVSAGGGAAAGWRLGPSWLLLGLVPLVPVLVALSVIDWRTRLLPRLVVLPALGVVFALLIAEWFITHDTAALMRAVLGMLVARGLFWLAWLLRPAAVGFGDVRLAALIGLVLGRLGWSDWGAGLYVGLFVFAAYGVARAVRVRSRSALTQALPYGPFMAAGALFGVLLVG